MFYSVPFLQGIFRVFSGYFQSVFRVVSGSFLLGLPSGSFQKTLSNNVHIGCIVKGEVRKVHFSGDVPGGFDLLGLGILKTPPNFTDTACKIHYHWSKNHYTHNFYCWRINIAITHASVTQL